MVGSWALLIAAFRAPLGSPSPWAIVEVFLLSGAVMLTWWDAATRILERRWTSYAFALLATAIVLFSPALVWVLGRWTTPAMAIILAAAWLNGGRTIVRDCREAPAWEIVSALAAGAALGFTYFLYVNTKGYGSVLSPEQTLLGTQHRDTLFHASIAAMIGQFGVPSTGLDGLVHVRYYFLSHALIGVTGRWIG